MINLASNIKNGFNLNFAPNPIEHEKSCSSNKVLFLFVSNTLWKFRDTVFPQIVFTETFFFEFNLGHSTYRCRNYSKEKTIQGRKLFKGGNYLRKYGILNKKFQNKNRIFLKNSTYFDLLFKYFLCWQCWPLG